MKATPTTDQSTSFFLCVCVKEREKDARRKSLFDWPVAFTKVILIVANCTLAKCSEEHMK